MQQHNKVCKELTCSLQKDKLGTYLLVLYNSDQHQISSCNINAYSTSEVMRIKDLITKGEFSCFNNFSTVLLYKETYGDKIGEFVL